MLRAGPSTVKAMSPCRTGVPSGSSAEMLPSFAATIPLIHILRPTSHISTLREASVSGAAPGGPCSFSAAISVFFAVGQVAVQLGRGLGPGAIVHDGTRATQTVIATALIDLVARAPAYGARPGLLIIGETVQLSPQYHAD